MVHCKLNQFLGALIKILDERKEKDIPPAL